jgi:putative restriction endonuclease
MSEGYKELFKDYLEQRNLKGSGKAKSYITALDYLDLVITKLVDEQYSSLYQITTSSEIQVLHKTVLKEQKKGTNSIFYGVITAESYWKGGFISAALNAYMTFLEEEAFVRRALQYFDQNIPFEKLTSHIQNQMIFEEGDFIGKESISEKKSRLNHVIFSRKIKSIYNNTCCLTGLSVPQLNRCGHIIPWSIKPNIRLDPRNGIYLSATYDAAFDKNLISIDKDYRLIVSRQIKHHYTKQVFQDYFQSFEGKQIQLPFVEFRPKKEYLEWHNSKLIV